MRGKERVQSILFVVVAVGTVCAQAASMAHMVESYFWANSGEMAVVLSVVTVVMAAVLVALGVISPAGRPRTAIRIGMGLLLLTEWAGNFAVGGLLVQQRMPAGVAAFFGLSEAVTQRLAAFLLSGFLPVISFICIFALTESVAKLLEEKPVNSYAQKAMQRHGLEPMLEVVEPAAAGKNGTSR